MAAWVSGRHEGLKCTPTVGEGQETLSLCVSLPYLGQPGAWVGVSRNSSGLPLVSARGDLGPSQDPCLEETLSPEEVYDGPRTPGLL